MATYFNGIRWAVLLGLCLLSIGAAAVVSQDYRASEASHRSSTRISSMESTGDEKFCVRIVSPSNQTHSNSIWTIAIVLTGNGTNDYEGLASGKVHFVGTSTPCAGTGVDGNSIRLYDHAINHETGHVLGLADGTCSGGVPTSVMHSIAYGCSSNYAYPTSGDLSSVTTAANGGN